MIALVASGVNRQPDWSVTAGGPARSHVGRTVASGQRLQLIDSGHPITFLGQNSERGGWLYYPVVLATKTPMPFLLFAGAGIAGLLRHRNARGWRWFAGLVLAAVAILLVSLASPINIGLRNVLIIYPLLAPGSAYGLVRLAEHSTRRATVLAAGVASVLLQGAFLWTSVPNQITDYNVLAGADPARISSDSNFDWGQGAVALERC